MIQSSGKQLTMIAVLDRNGVIGLDGRMPWHLPADLKHFKETTLGKPLIMGRKTFDSIGRALPGRQNIVISRQQGLVLPDCEMAASLEMALELARGREVMIIGGGEIYRLAMPLASRLVITELDTVVTGGQVWFPPIDPALWIETARVERAPDEKNPVAMNFVEYRRK